jgi:hypothetical protein
LISAFDRKELSKIMANLTDIGIIVGGRLPPGGQWHRVRTSTQDVRAHRARKRGETGKLAESFHAEAAGRGTVLNLAIG